LIAYWKSTMQINIKKLSPLAKAPTYATDGSGWN